MDIHFNALILAVLAALLVAGKNYWLKATDQRMLLYGASNAVCLGIALVLMPFMAVPSGASMLFLLSSSLLYTFKILFDLHAFQSMAVSRFEPIQSSMRIAVMVLCSPLLLGETITPLQILALILVFAGLNMLMDWRFFTRHAGLGSIGKCCIAGLLGGMLSISDIMGIRVSGAPFAYIVWNLLIGAPTIILALAWHKNALLGFLNKYRRNIVMMCACDVISYGLILYILYGLKVGEAIPLLNVSVIFTALLGMRYLDERVSRQNWAAIILVTLSISAVQLT